MIELGPGQGALTGHLFERFPKIAVEIDERMIGVLRETLPELDLAHGDMLQLDLGAMADEAGGRLSLVSNTPFYLTSPLLFKLVAATEHVESAVLTTQKEVCDKILSPPSKKDYGILAVMLQLFGGPKHLFDLPPEAFAPVPKVHSSVLSLSPSAIPPGEDEPLTPSQRAAILGLLKVTFEVRRKMLRVSLRKMIETGTRAASHLLLCRHTHTLSLSLALICLHTHTHKHLTAHRRDTTAARRVPHQAARAALAERMARPRARVLWRRPRRGLGRRRQAAAKARAPSHLEGVQSAQGGLSRLRRGATLERHVSGGVMSVSASVI